MRRIVLRTSITINLKFDLLLHQISRIKAKEARRDVTYAEM